MNNEYQLYKNVNNAELKFMRTVIPMAIMR